MALRHASEEGRLVEPAARRKHALWLPEFRPLCHAARNQLTDRLHLRARIDRANIGVLIHRVTNTQCGHALLEPRNELFGDRLLHQEATPCATDLALIKEDPVDHALHRLVERRILKDDVRRLATELQRQCLPLSRDPLRDLDPN